MSTFKSIALLSFSLMPMVISTSIHAELMSADEIVKNINARDEGVSVSRNLTMLMVDKRGKKRERETKAFRKYLDNEKRTAIFYLSPKNVKDTAFLTFDYDDKSVDDDQWLYLPAMRKVRRISAADRGDYFLGTDFSYEDIKLETRVSIDDYTRVTIGKEQIDGVDCFVVEEKTIDSETATELGHWRRQNYIDNEIWFVRKSVLWDVNNKPLKTIYFKDISLVQGIWTAHVIDVENHITGHRTTFTFSNIDYETPLDDNVFTQNALRRGL